MGMNALYECSVMHCRLKPKRHAFNYRVFMFSIDIDELPRLASQHFCLGHNRFNLFSIHDEDHITMGQSGGIRANLTSWLAQQGIDCPSDAKIQLITFPRVLGYGFNPVSFYYVTTRTGEPIIAVAEVVNTFREMKLYAMQSLEADHTWKSRTLKNFYVSPFSDPGDEFDFRLGLPGKDWRVKIDNYCNQDLVLLSGINGKSCEISTFRLLFFSLKYPLLSFKIIFLIHWHALLLWIQKVPFLRKSERCEAQVGVMRPHSSLSKNLP
jgi:uncharacterized protein